MLLPAIMKNKDKKSFGLLPKLFFHGQILIRTPHVTNVYRDLLNNIDHLSVIEIPPIMTSEDFSYYLQQVPGIYFYTGSATEDSNTQFQHHPKFNIDEQAMKNSAKGFLFKYRTLLFSSRGCLTK